MEQIDLLRKAIDVLERKGIPYMLVGSYASGVYGEPRLTQDIDIVVDLPPGQVADLCAAFPESEDFYVSVSAATQAVHQGGQFNVIHFTSASKIDFMVARRDVWGRTQFARRIRRPVLRDLECFTAQPEDVILAKLWYYQEGGSEKHLRDITGIFRRRIVEIDREYVAHWAGQLGVMEEWTAVLSRLGEFPTDHRPPTTDHSA